MSGWTRSRPPPRVLAIVVAALLGAWLNVHTRDVARAVDVSSADVYPTHATRDPEATGPRYDVVIAGGRVMDPETGFDKVANVGITGGKITAVTEHRIAGRTTIDANGKVVAPGFIDNLSYEPNSYGIWFKVADGVTTTMGMHGIDGSPADFFRRYQGRLPVNYGGAFDDPYWREKLGVGPYEAPTKAQIAELARLADEQIRAGWAGIDFEPEYAPGTSHEEMLALARVAARHRVPVFFHVRYADMLPPGTNMDALGEVIAIAKESGAAVHVEHINSTGGTFSMAESLALLTKARAEGLDVTACVYPYAFWSTFAGSARFDPGWQERFRISYGDLEVPSTGERLTKSSFPQYRRQNKVVVAYAIPEADVTAALRSPLVMLGSDSILVPEAGRHPRGAGAFARTLGVYVRERGVLTLMDALAKMTIMPARRLGAGAPAMRTKGRLRTGMDADITIFDPDTVADRATVRAPARESVGIEWVLVAGRIVKDPSGLHRDVLPGRPITGV